MLVVLLASGCTATPVADDGPEDEAGVTTAATAQADDEEPEADGEAAGTEGTERPDPTDAGDERDEDEEREENVPLAEIEWALTPAGPGSPSVNEDSIYKILDDLDPQACAALLDPSAGWFDPSTFGTGERSVHLFFAAAQLCAGDRVSAVAGYERALQFEWEFAVEQPLHSRVCNVWDAVTRIVDPDAGPCALQELRVDEPTDTEEPEGPGEPSDDPTTDTEEPEGPGEPPDDAMTDAEEPPAPDEPPDDATTSETVPQETEERDSDEANEVGDESSLGDVTT